MSFTAQSADAALSLADALGAKLLVGLWAVSKRAVALHSGPECTRLLATIVSSKRFNRGNSTQVQGFCFKLRVRHPRARDQYVRL